MLTVIPDIHADPERLERSLAATPRGARIGFLGDFIDAGKAEGAVDDRAVLERVRALVSDGRAIGVMGNHELNAILYHRSGADGAPLRAHSEKNKDQHMSFIDAFGTGTGAALDWTAWFLEALPLWREQDGLRLVHACWAEEHIAIIRARRPNGFLLPEGLPEIAAESTDFGKAVKLLVSGPEVRLPEPYGFQDSKGHWRTEMSLAWWQADARTWREAALSVPDVSTLPEGPMTGNTRSLIYPADALPVLVGHYKMTREPRIEHERAACLDYPGAPCVYHWQGEGRLSDDRLEFLA
jgi:hypothetical protein